MGSRNPSRSAAVTAATTVSRGTRSTSATSARSRWASTATANATAQPSAARPRPKSRTSSTKLHDEINAGIRPRPTTQLSSASEDWLDSIERDPHTMATYRGQAKKWIYPRIGATKLKDFSATDAERFFKDIAQVLSKRTLVMIKSTLGRSIRRAQKYDLIGRNVVELVDLPAGPAGHPSRAMTEEQAGKVLKAASGKATGYVKVVKAAGPVRGDPRGHRDRRAGLRHKARTGATVTEISTELDETTCRTAARNSAWTTTRR